MADKVTTMVGKVDLRCPCCRKKIKKILAKFPGEIRDPPVYDDQKGTVTITVVSCNPEKIRDKLYYKGGKIIKCIEIKEPKVTKKAELAIIEPKVTNKPELAIIEPKVTKKPELAIEEPKVTTTTTTTTTPPPPPPPVVVQVLIPVPVCPPYYPMGVCCWECYEGCGGKCCEGCRGKCHEGFHEESWCRIM